MKRLVPLLAILFIFPSVSIYSKDIYIQNESYESEDILTADVIAQVSKNAESVGLELVDYAGLDLVPYKLSWGEYKRLPLESEKLEEEKKKIEETQKRYSGMSWITITSIDGKSPEEEIADLDRRIKAAKEKEKNLIEPSTCYPRVLFKVDTKEDWRGNVSVQISMNLQMDAETDRIFSAEFESNYISSKKDKINLCAKCIESFFPAIINSERTSESSRPEIIDQRTMTELGGTRSGNSISVAARDDFSFVMRAKDSIIDYSPTWDVKENITKKINGSTKLSTYWVTYSSDGKTVLFANPGPPSVISIDEKDTVSGKVQYKYPSTNSTLSFFNSGNPYLVDTLARKIYLPQKDGRLLEMEFPLRMTDSIKAGLDDTMCFQSDNAVFVYSTKNKSLQKIIYLNAENDEYICQILSDSSMLTLNQKKCTLSRFSADGLNLWTIQLDGSMKYSTYCGGRNGMYFFYDAISNILWRLAESDAKLPPVLAALKSNGNLQGSTLAETAAIYRKNADTLYAAKSFENALDNYTKYLEICPNDTDAADKRLICEVSVNKKAAAEKTEEALDLFDEYGEETARPAYQEAMKLLEKLRKQVPWDEEVQEAYADLKNAFSLEEGFSTAEIPSVSVEAFDLASLFPVLMNVYASNPAGYITVRNNGSTALKNVSVTAYVRKYMDFPSKGGEIKVLNPGQQEEIQINTVLNKNALKVTENSVLQMQFTVSWEENGKSRSLVITRPVTLYKKSAMSWADTAMLSCFIQPNDPNVSTFVFNALAQNKADVISTNVTKAIVLSNAIGAIPLTYVSDPNTPLSQVIDNEYSVDTVRFPAETLSLKGGDCDDMTTLFCSVLESAGIPSALITTPGHIFAAFDTGLKASTAWNNLDEDYRTITINGNIWIPVETTILEDGFEAAWKSASKEIAKQQYEYTILQEAWEVYSSAANPDGQKEVSFQKEKLATMNTTSFTEMKAQMKNALQKIKTGTPSDMNTVARLWYSIGEKEKAAKVLATITETSPQYKSAYTNLESLYTELGMTEEAAKTSERAKKIFGSKTVSTSEDKKTRAKSQSGMVWED
ncbi:MAG: transglutaminase domain-containing protein [Treponema sp.]|nr:transglutaminase domain-containing protein [Treponema sp.]